MGVLNKLMFWKKEDEFDFESVAKKEMQSAGIPPGDLNIDTKSPWEEKSVFDAAEDHPPITGPPIGQKFSPQPYQSQQSMPSTGNRDLDLINSKLDTLRAMLQTIEQRMATLERAFGTEEKPKQRLW